MRQTRERRGRLVLRACRAAVLLVAVAIPMSTQAQPATAQETLPSIAMRQATEAHIQEALYQEIYGQNEERRAHLEAALENSPNSLEARWQLGLMKVGTQWRTVEEVIEAGQVDARLAEYIERRDACEETVEGHSQLARWCERRRFEDRAEYHWREAYKLAPGNESIMRELGLVRIEDNRIIAREEWAAEQQYAITAQRAEARWRSQLETLRRNLHRGSQQSQENVLAELRAIDDEWCVAPLEELFFPEFTEYEDDNNPELHLIGIEVLGNIPHHWATESLARQAVAEGNANVRDAAIEALTERPLHEAVPVLLHFLQPLYSLEIVGEQRNGIEEHTALERRVTREAIYESRTELGAITDLELDELERRWNFRINSLNAEFAINNKMATHVLQVITGAGELDEPQAWWQWWEEHNRLSTTQLDLVTTIVALEEIAFFDDQYSAELSNREREQATLAFIARLPDWSVVFNPAAGRHQPVVDGKFYQEAPPSRYICGTYILPPELPFGYGTIQDPVLVNDLRLIPRGAYVYIPANEFWPMHNYYDQSFYPNHSCFAAGTPVWTEQGMKAIEDILPGDRVLSQDVETGELSFKIVTGCTVREPTEVFSVAMGGESIVASGGHPFWVNGQGWRMVCELESGDSLHGLEGSHLLSDIVAQEEHQVVYNLVVEDNHNYFVGDSQLLVHDVTLREPTRAIVPGLVETQ